MSSRKQFLIVLVTTGLVLLFFGVSSQRILHAEGDEAKPMVLRNLPGGPYTMTLTDGVKIQNVGSAIPIEYAGVRLLLVEVRNGDKVEKAFVNPTHLISLKEELK